MLVLNCIGWDKTKPISSVIATIYSQSSYGVLVFVFFVLSNSDSLFRSVPQEPPEPHLAVSLFQVVIRTNLINAGVVFLL